MSWSHTQRVISGRAPQGAQKTSAPNGDFLGGNTRNDALRVKMSVSHTFPSSARETSQAANVTAPTLGENSPNPPSDDHGTAWKSGFFRLLDSRGPGRMSWGRVLGALGRIANRHGQVAISLPSLARKVGGNIKTVRRIVHFLSRCGKWLRLEKSTWGDLARALPGWRVPDWSYEGGTACHLFTLLDGQGAPAAQTFGVSVKREGRAPSVARPRNGNGHYRRRPSPALRREPEGGPCALPIWDRGASAEALKAASNEGFVEGGVPPNLGGEGSLPKSGVIQRNPSGDLSERKEREEAPGGASSSFFVSALKGEGARESGGGAWQEPWSVLIEAYASEYLESYGAPPGRKQQSTPPEDQREAGERLALLARRFCADLGARSVQLEAREAMALLAGRAFKLWLARKGTGDFLERAGHPLVKFCEELTPRVREARNELLKELTRPKVDKPARTPEELQAERAEREAKRAEEEAKARAAALAFARATKAAKPDFTAMLGGPEQAEAERQQALERRRQEAKRALAAAVKTEQGSAETQEGAPKPEHLPSKASSTLPRPFVPWRPPSGPWAGPRASASPLVPEEGETPPD